MPSMSVATCCSVARITHRHIELDAHDIILAEGLPAESFRDTGSGAVEVLHPNFHDRGVDDRFCAPIIRDGSQLAATTDRAPRRAVR